jgi:hypothetical protein
VSIHKIDLNINFYEKLEIVFNFMADTELWSDLTPNPLSMSWRGGVTRGFGSPSPLVERDLG